MSTPPWGHKPPAVDDHYRYWSEPPPALSPRVEYWMRRLSKGSWVPNKYFLGEGYDARTVWLGVYMWEYFNIIYPVIRDLPEEPVS